MRVEWAQCIACADCWEEEVILLQEEMRRVVQFLEWKSCNWLSKVDRGPGTITPAIHTGISTYAKKQGSLYHNLAVRFSQHWYSTLLSLSLPHTWAAEFLNKHNAPLVNPDFKKQNRGSQGSDHLRVSTVCPLAQPSPSTAADGVLPPPSNTEATNRSAQIIPDSEASMGSDESGSDSSDSWVE